MEALCKFTPLGFETFAVISFYDSRFAGVNLPRWGLKRHELLYNYSRVFVCKYTPLGFETKG